MLALITQYESSGKPRISHGGMDGVFASRKIRSMAGNNLQAIRKRAHLTQGDVAERLGVSVPQISRWEGGRDNIPSNRLPSLAEAYGASIGEIFGDTEYQPLGPRLFVKGSVAAGVFKEAWEVDPDEWEVFTGRADIAAPAQRRFGLRVVGDSMNEVYPPGTVLECVQYEADELIPSGKRVIAVRHRGDGTMEATVKELVRDGDGVEWLVPRSTNPSFQAFRGDQPDSPDITRVEIVAVVVGSYRPE
jgi:transcriptional regulator with XRE-family HTH domain